MDSQAKASTSRRVSAACASHPTFITTRPMLTASLRPWPGDSGANSPNNRRDYSKFVIRSGFALMVGGANRTWRPCEARSDEAIQNSSFRDGPKDQTSDVQLHIGESLDSGFDAEPVIGPGRGRTPWARPGM